MKSLRHVSMLFTAILFLSFSSCSSMPRNGYEDQDRSDTIKKSFRVGTGGTLHVDTDFGAIEVGTASGNQVDIEIQRRVDVWSREEADEILDDFKFDFDQRGDDVYVRGEYTRGHRFWDSERRRLKIHFYITVPEKYNVDLNTSGGSISVDDLEGEVRSKTSGGSLRFGNIQGPVLGKTSGGSITLRGCTGDADVNTSGGGIDIGEVDGNVDAHTSGGSISIERAKGQVIAETSGGGIQVEEVMGTIEASTSGGSISARITKQPKHRCYLETSGGSVKVYLAEDIAVDLDAHTSSGHVETDFPVTVQGRINKRSLQANINGGGPTLKLRTSGGSIYLKKW